MPDPSTLALFAVASLALAATPGPDMLLLASRSAAQGRVAGFATLGGIVAGTYVHALAAAFGLSQLFLLVPVAYDVVRYAGAAYLLYLGWKCFRAPPISFKAGAGAPTLSASRMFGQGLLTNLLNPKMALFVIALFPQFLAPGEGSVAVQVVVLATILNVIGLVVNGTVIWASSLAGEAIARRVSGKLRRFARVPNYLLGAVFTGLALRLALEERR